MEDAKASPGGPGLLNQAICILSAESSGLLNKISCIYPKKKPY